MNAQQDAPTAQVDDSLLDGDHAYNTEHPPEKFHVSFMIRVAAAVIQDRGRVFIARRAPGKRQAGLWEFPGGKLEDGESPAQCLVRELREELGLEIEPGQELQRVVHEYEFGRIELVAVLCRCVKAEVVSSTDHDVWEWVMPEQLNNYPLAPADIPIAKALSSSAC